jgi:serine protease
MKLLRPATRWLPAVALALAAAWAPSHAELGPKLAQSAPAQSLHARVIVQFKDSLAASRRVAQSAGGAGSGAAQMTPEAVSAALAQRATSLGARVGLLLRAGRAIDGHMQVLTAEGMDSATLAKRLSADSQVSWAVVDGWRQIQRVPDDPYYVQGPPEANSAGGPTAGQWYLRPPTADALSSGKDTEIVSSIDAEHAWDITTGSDQVVVAVLDTGIRAEHPDFAGKVLPGYDMIGVGANDPSSVVQTANDGNGADSDPSDPGDWVTDAEVNDQNSPFYHCTEKQPDGTYKGEPSSWHGTQTAGLIGALTDNGTGIAGVGWNVKLLPVRVLGKCGGYDSDIAAGMLWAAGLNVPGVPANPHPAKVLNMSLGDSGTTVTACSQTIYPSAVQQVLNAGAVIVASAGNGSGHAINPPGNCSGIITVAGVRHTGTKVGFSDIGPEVTIAAPAGNCVNVDPNSDCVYPIMSTTNSGTTTPAASTYTDAYNYGVGTSFSAPLVSGTAALMFSVNPNLTPTQVRSILQATARVFPFRGADPSSGVVGQCTVPTSTSADQAQCYCTTSTCGAGLLNTYRAVYAAANSSPTVHITVDAGPYAGRAVTLSGATTVAASGRSINAWQWTLIDGGGIVSGFADGSAQSVDASPVLTPSGTGQFSIRLTVTDSSGVQGVSEQTFTVSAAPSSGGTGGNSSGSSSGGGAMSAAWLAGLAAVTLVLAVLRRCPSFRRTTMSSRR